MYAIRVRAASPDDALLGPGREQRPRRRILRIRAERFVLGAPISLRWPVVLVSRRHRLHGRQPQWTGVLRCAEGDEGARDGHELRVPRDVRPRRPTVQGVCQYHRRRGARGEALVALLHVRRRKLVGRTDRGQPLLEGARVRCEYHRPTGDGPPRHRPAPVEQPRVRHARDRRERSPRRHDGPDGGRTLGRQRRQRDRP